MLFGLILFIDRWLRGGTHALLATGLADETAHLSTVAIVLLAFPAIRNIPLVMGCLIGSVAIDVDHLPLILGSSVLTESTHRPLTHSLLALGIVLIVTTALGGFWQPFSVGFAVGLAAHFVRDMATSTAGVPLLWPASDTGFLLAYPLYLAALVCALVRILTMPDNHVPTRSHI